MSQARYQSVLAAAEQEGLLRSAELPALPESRPWPVVLLTALGAWLAAVPLLIVLGLLLFDSFRHGAGAGVLGGVILCGAIAVLRARPKSFFVEQLAIPVLMAGLGLVVLALADGRQGEQVALVLCPLLLAMVVAVPQPWLRALLGAAAACMAALAMLGEEFFGYRHEAGMSPWLVLHLLLAAGLAVAALLLHRLPAGGRARAAAIAEALCSGWLLATLAGLALWAGMSFLVGATLGVETAPGMAGEASRWSDPLLHLGLPNFVSAALALAGCAWLVRRWPDLRQAWLAGVALVLTGLAWLMPTLGACLLVLALCAASRRWRLATAAAVAAVWIVGAFYYALSWPLASKAAALVVAGAVLAALAVWGLHRPAPAAVAEPTPVSPVAAAGFGAWRWGIALSAVLVLLAANLGIWKNERLIAQGQAVFVALAPVDPRSLMQGDYMALNFLPRAATPGLDQDQEAFSFEHPRVVFKLSAEGIATLQGPDDGRPLATDEVAIQLRPKRGRWVLVTDAFFFKEGEAARWAQARYGEFRVDASGKALLVGLRGAKLQPL